MQRSLPWEHTAAMASTLVTWLSSLDWVSTLPMKTQGVCQIEYEKQWPLGPKHLLWWLLLDFGG